MKTNIIVIILVLLSHVLFGQERNATHVLFPSGEETIEGILIRPNVEGKVPAVVFQQGSGNFAFEGYEKEAWGPHKFYIEDVLLELGYAVLYCNKRGLGESTGNWHKNDFYGRADDAYAAVSYLKDQAFIDADRIGVSGHSQGGWIAQITAAEHDDIAFIICLAGPTVGVQPQMEGFYRYMLECEGYSGETLDKKVEKKNKGSLRGAKAGKILPFIGSARHHYLTHDYNNDDVMKSIKCPTLLLFAEFDVNVDPDMNISHLNELYNDDVPDNFTIEIMPSGQHGFYIVKDRCVPWDKAAKDNQFDSAYKKKIMSWVQNLD